MEEITKKKTNRVKHRFAIPPSLVGVQDAEVPVTSFALVKITLMEERDSAEVGRGSPMSALMEQLYRSLVMVNDQPVSRMDGSVERALSDMDPKIRSLVAAAFNELHGVDKDDLKSFLASRTATSG